MPKQVSAIAYIFIALFSSGLPAKAYQLEGPGEFDCSTHAVVAPPPKVNAASQTLLISLKSNLGRLIGTNEIITQLKSPGKPLTLKDSSGLIYTASNINLKWKPILLEKPIKINRKVIGPFASFESAEAIAKKIRKNDKCVAIANPKLWEVWTSSDKIFPKEIKFKNIIRTIKYQSMPFLVTQNNEFQLLGEIELTAPDGLKWDGGVYMGPFLIKPNAYGTWTLIEKVSLEKYLEGVVPYEIGSSAPLAALSAQAILARTWALANIKRYMIDGYHLCSTTQCQVYKDPSKVGSRIKNAIQQTSGKVLLWNNQPIHAFYHASNGGVMAGVEEAWSMTSLPYLQAKIDGYKKIFKFFNLPINTNQLKSFLLQDKFLYGTDHKLFRWTRILKGEKINQYLKSALIDLKSPQEINVLERGLSGRVVALEIVDSDKDSKIVLKLDTIRRTFNFLPSTLFIVKKLEEGVWEFQGGGFGHGAGLSQAGAIDLALMGWQTEQILRHYYPGSHLRTLPENWIAP